MSLINLALLMVYILYLTHCTCDDVKNLTKSGPKKPAVTSQKYEPRNVRAGMRSVMLPRAVQTGLSKGAPPKKNTNSAPNLKDQKKSRAAAGLGKPKMTLPPLKRPPAWDPKAKPPNTINTPGKKQKLPPMPMKAIRTSPKDIPQIKITTRIVGGRPVNPHELPYQVGIMYSGILVCGGSIINDWWILSASHCFEGNPPLSTIQVLAGEHDLLENEGTEQLMNVAAIITHEYYNPDIAIIKNDITLLKLTAPLVLNQFVQAIQLAETNRPAATGMSLVSGWGRVKDGGLGSNVLQSVMLPIVELRECEQLLTNPIGPDQICTGRIGIGGKDSCQGDSGGPLVVKENDRFIQIGIVSYGIGCANKDYPGVYTNVSQFRSWIESKIRR